MNDREQTEAWSLVAGNVALDFVNTVGGNDTTADLDAIAGYDLLLVWSVRAGTLAPDHAEALRRRSHRLPAEAAAVMEHARDLRAAMDTVFRGLLDGDPIAPAWARVRPVLVESVARAEPVQAADRMAWSWAEVTGLDAPLLPVAHAAAELVTDPRLALLRQCGRCRWLFLDTSRNHGRRWCEMSTCGVAQKVERQAVRRRES